MRVSYVIALLATMTTGLAYAGSERAERWELHISHGPDEVHECSEGRRSRWNWVAATSIENDFADDNLFSLNCSRAGTLWPGQSRYWIEFQPDSKEFFEEDDQGARYVAQILIRVGNGWKTFGTYDFLMDELCGWSEADITAKSIIKLLSAEEIKFVSKGSETAIVQVTKEGAQKLSSWFESCDPESH